MGKNSVRRDRTAGTGGEPQTPTKQLRIVQKFDKFYAELNSKCSGN
jgi:hypothetical protein